jgi:hypothetical protein
MLCAKERLECPLRGFRGEESATEAQREDVARIQLLHDPLEELIGDVVKDRRHRGETQYHSSGVVRWEERSWTRVLNIVLKLERNPNPGTHNSVVLPSMNAAVSQQSHKRNLYRDSYC